MGLSTTPCSVLVSRRAARTPARETLVAPSCVETSFLELSPGAMAVLSLDTLGSTLRPHASLTGSITIFKSPVNKTFNITLEYISHHFFKKKKTKKKKKKKKK